MNFYFLERNPTMALAKAGDILALAKARDLVISILHDNIEMCISFLSIDIWRVRKNMYAPTKFEEINDEAISTALQFYTCLILPETD